jgi:sulfur relay (sulfurtransferase) DsrF/TusC family protein
MKLTLQQQQAIRNQISGVTLVEDTIDELYDHVLSAIERQPPTAKFSLKAVDALISAEFPDMINTAQAQKNYQRVNNIGGLIVFAIALVTYWLTMEPTVSFWDCGEFISSATKLQVGHQPGAPLFVMIGKLFSLLALGNPAKIAYWINFSAVIASAGTILFLFWTITALAAKVFRKENLNNKTFGIMAAGTIGALAYTFSDTFWFSAVESEVYALSSLFSAVTFWAILKWEKDTNDKWLVFIAFIVGLSTGVHLLSLLAIPAVTLVYYFKKADRPGLTGMIKAFAAGCLIVALVQFGVIQYVVLYAAKFDLLFVNSLGLFFGSGALFFILLIVGIITWAISYSIKKKKYNLNLGLLCLTGVLFGFSSYFMIIIRANAKTDINLSNPDNAFALYDYLGRTNYGSTPLAYGNTFDAKTVDNITTGKTYRKGKSSYEVSGETFKTTYDKNLLFPRTYSMKPGHQAFYREWLGMADGETPSFAKNISFFSSWQVGFMYWRYFLWNFAGRQNDIQGQGRIDEGNWITGIKPIDALRLGNQQNLPQTVLKNEGHNVFYGLPLILGIAGLFWLYRRNKQDALIVVTLFFFTGIAIILYLNQDPLQVRERDYAYAGSFYAFAIAIGFGVFALKELLTKIVAAKSGMIAASVICMLAVPVLMASQGWDDHNRSQKTTARDFAKNYLNSCAPNAILFTNADNDTYPLWYAQQVEGIRTDVRVICVQFLADDAYINQLKKQMSESAPLPISMAEEKYVQGKRDYMPFVDYGLKDSVELKDLLAVMTSDDKGDQVEMNDGSFLNFLPSRKLKLSTDSDQLVKTHSIEAKDKDKVVPAMEWEFSKPYVSKGDLALMDILVHNNWVRPIYFATLASGDTYMGLEKYLHMEGYAYRLLPLKTTADDTGDKEERTNTDVMYANMMNKLDFSSLKKASYLDPETRRVLNSTWKFSNTLTVNLIREGKTTAANHMIDKTMRELPLRNYAITDTLSKMYTIQNLYALNRTVEANKLAKETSAFLTQEFDYISALEPEYQMAHRGDIEFGLSILNSLQRMTAAYQQKAVNQEIKNSFNNLVNQFGVKS